jgi:hypothetical protein
MKKLLLATFLVGLAAGAYAQGFIALDNNNNNNISPTATSNGLFFIDNGGGPVLVTQDFNASFYGGTDSANLILIQSFFGATATGDVTGLGQPGKFSDPTGASYPVAGSTTTAFFRIEAWTGSATSYANATTRGTSPVFGNGVAAPPTPAPDFVNMPAIVMSGSVVPEPSTFALAGLGAAALLIFRRRK